MFNKEYRKFSLKDAFTISLKLCRSICGIVPTPVEETPNIFLSLCLATTPESYIESCTVYDMNYLNPYF